MIRSARLSKLTLARAMEPGLILLHGLLVTIFWMVVGCRAMRAHERPGEQGKRT